MLLTPGMENLQLEACWYFNNFSKSLAYDWKLCASLEDEAGP